jgi:hypothetical protein
VPCGTRRVVPAVVHDLGDMTTSLYHQLANDLTEVAARLLAVGDHLPGDSRLRKLETAVLSVARLWRASLRDLGDIGEAAGQVVLSRSPVLQHTSST